MRQKLGNSKIFCNFNSFSIFINYYFNLGFAGYNSFPFSLFCNIWSYCLKVANESTLDQNTRSEGVNAVQVFQLNNIDDRQGEREVLKAKISLSIAIGFIACHSVKWINNILEIKYKQINFYNLIQNEKYFLNFNMIIFSN